MTSSPRNPRRAKRQSPDYETWRYIAPIQKAAWARRTFEFGTWGGEFRSEFAPQPGEIVALEHWFSSNFANTDLDLQLKKHGIHQLIVTGLVAHTCVEATVRFAAELEHFQPDWKHGCCIDRYCIRPRQAIALFPVRLNML
jgi:nicotinamidase-related amidase